MNFIEHLTTEHRRFEKELKTLTAQKGLKQSQLLPVLKELQQHMVKEEKYLYPKAENVLNKNNQLKMVQDGYLEHTQAKDYIIKLTNTDYINEQTLKQDIKTLYDELAHHHQDEETELFPKLSSLMSEDEVSRMSINMDAFDENRSSFVTA